MNAFAAPPFRYRSIWISDIHLGTRGCNAALLLDFLRSTDSDYLYLVGDIIDFWRLRKAWYWRQDHNDVIQKILRKARKGTRVIYIPGNHDEWFRDMTPRRFGRVAVLREATHTMLDGRRFLVMHGDHFDGVVKYAKWLAYIGDNAYQMALNLNTWFNLVRRRLGFSYWSLSAYLKHKVKNAVEHICNFEKALADEARRRNLQGVICGHIHTAEIRQLDGIVYCNDGDWVESCTALVEHLDGRLEILHWAERGRAGPSVQLQPEAEPFRMDTADTKSVSAERECVS
ncbi:Ser/threonine protein phosphatase [Candidatus Defluviicoccus seviourii]|uniref:Ser/threonine protein phosphatase n=1 Tax=Candidatus Defluviicoccus seviourii TaxID=2565273 RepID=A0A564WDL7_9PROT|nr:Ser/threonine protein phosphatase [Candidatus Defluviicoccus seviourii]